MKKAILSMGFATIIGFTAQAFALPPPEIRVLITSDKSTLISGFSEPIKVLLPGKRPDQGFVFKDSITITAGDYGLIVNNTPVGTAATILNTSKRYRIKDRSFRGKIEVIWKSKNKFFIINHLPMEEYLAGLLGSEVYPSWPIEALKAQAVAARTYALHHADAKKRSGTRADYDVTATVLSQVYEGTHKEGFRTHAACRETNGMALLKSGRTFSAYYHSCCGGLTEHAHNVWVGENGPKQITDKFCKRSPKMSWSWNTSIKNFISNLRSNGVSIGKILGVSTELQSDSPRIEFLSVIDGDSTKKIKATELRRIFGYSNIKSTWFDVDIKGASIRFAGRGYGHGVGMCQWGAKGMADAGFTYEQILKFYYPEAGLARVY